MRMSTDPDRDEARAAETIAAALEAGITVFDTAHAYGRGEDELGHNERLLARALLHAGAASKARVITKGGMTRPGGAWVPDGRAKAIRRDCEASLDGLGGLPIDLYLIHAPDPRTPWSTSLRALGRLLDEGLVGRIGLSNVNRPQLDAALELIPVSAVQVALSRHDDRARRSGVLARCEELGIALVAHSPLGGPRRAGALARAPKPGKAETSQAATGTPAEHALVWLLALSPAIVAIPGARRPESARSAARAAHLPPPREAIATRAPRAVARPAPEDSEVVLIMGIPGAGKTHLAEQYTSRGYVRLNRDERGGGLREIAGELERCLRAGIQRVVLDNTYLTRAARSYVTEAAARHTMPTRCVWLETPLAQAQVNLVERLLDRFGSLPTPEDLRAHARHAAGMLSPTQQMRALRELEPPACDEGFAAVEIIPFARTAPLAPGRGGVFIAAPSLVRPGSGTPVASPDPRAPHLIFDWRPDGLPAALEPVAERARAAIPGPVEVALCPHGGGPPVCWCRPPLPGLPLAFAHVHRLDPARSILIGTSSAHRTLAAALGARYIAC